MCESRGGRPGLPVPSSPYGLCGRKATLNLNSRDQKLCETRDGRPGLPVPNSPLNSNKETMNRDKPPAEAIRLVHQASSSSSSSSSSSAE